MDKNDPSSVNLITYCHYRAYGVYSCVCVCASVYWVTVWLPSMKEIVVQNDPVGEDELVIQDEAALKRVTFCSLGMSNTKDKTVAKKVTFNCLRFLVTYT